MIVNGYTTCCITFDGQGRQRSPFVLVRWRCFVWQWRRRVAIVLILAGVRHFGRLVRSIVVISVVSVACLLVRLVLCVVVAQNKTNLKEMGRWQMSVVVLINTDSFVPSVSPTPSGKLCWVSFPFRVVAAIKSVAV